jgi:murein L,D-transpeptidase YcbB/YkuD
MRGQRSLLFASTALALILSAPVSSIGKDISVASTPAASIPAGQSSTQSPAAIGNEPGSVSGDTIAAPAATMEQPAVSDPLAALDPADRAVAEKIRDLLASKGERIFTNKKERSAVEAFYQNRNLAPLWLDKGVANARAKSVIAQLKNADADGLNAADYAPPNFADVAADALAEAELKLTRAMLTYARHVQAGRFPYTRMSRNIELPQVTPEPADILSGIAAAADAGQALDAFSPPQEPYQKLKVVLAELRAHREAATSAAAKSELSKQIEIVIANMERWRWYPRDLGSVHVVVNHPDFTLRVMHNGAQVWTTRVVIGKPSMPTPLLSETMKSITVNPTWHVPPSIVHNEYLPALAQDPTVLERMGLRVSYGGGDVEITMPPGDNNALGRVRFNFPNRFLVYQHDTPDKNLFAESVRAYSHGCMRVQDPAKYAEVLLKIVRPGEHWTAEKVKGMYGRSEQDITLQPTPVWVHLTYQTAFVDGAGKLQFRRDVYNLDSRTLAAIRSGAGEPASERKRDPEMAVQSTPRRTVRSSQSPQSSHNGFLFPSTMYDAPSYARSTSPRVIYR